MSTFKFSKIVALRYLWSRRSEAFISIITIISILGVAIGVMVLNMVMAIMTGFEYELREKIVGTNSHIVVRKLGGYIEGWEQTAQAIEAVKGVSSVSAFTYNQGLIRANKESSGILLRGLEQGSSAFKQLESNMARGQKGQALFEPPEVEITLEDGRSRSVALPGIIVGAELARSLGLFIGMPVSILAPNVSSSPFGLMPKYKRFVVAGTYSSGLVEYESALAYVALAEAQKFFRLGDSISGFEVRVNDIDAAPLLSKKIVNSLGHLSTGIYAQDWTVTNKPLWDALKLEKKVYFIVLLLIIIMASFSIITSLIMIVLEKRRDIAILRTMGASSASIGNIFRIQGAVIGAFGTILGLIAGFIGCVALREYGFPLDEKIFPVSTVPVRMELINFVLVGISAFIICCFATLYPARRASRLIPSEVLRYE